MKNIRQTRLAPNRPNELVRQLLGLADSARNKTQIAARWVCRIRDNFPFMSMPPGARKTSTDITDTFGLCCLSLFQLTIYFSRNYYWN